MFSKDDKMGDAEFEIKPYIEALRMQLDGLPSGTIVTTVQPSRRNCLAEESKVTWIDGKLVQDLVLRLRHVECGEVEAQLQWIDLPGSKGLWMTFSLLIILTFWEFFQTEFELKVKIKSKNITILK